MKPAFKKFSIYGIAAAIGEREFRKSPDERIRWRSQKLMEAGRAAVAKCGGNVDKNVLGRIGMKIREACDEVNTPAEVLAFALSGLFDLQYHVHDGTEKYIDILIKRALWLLRAFDPCLEAHDMYNEQQKRYERWAA